MNKIDVPLTADEEHSVLAILDKISIFGGLSTEQLERVIRELKRESYEEDEIVFRQGDKPGHIYIIQSGRVLIGLDDEGRFLELIIYDVGQCFGETAAIGLIPHSASAIADTACDLLALPVSALNTFFKQDPGLFGMLMMNIAREACRRLHKSDEVLLHYAHNQKK